MGSAISKVRLVNKDNSMPNWRAAARINKFFFVTNYLLGHG